MADYPITTEVKIDGVAAPVYASDLAEGEPTILDGLALNWGRDNILDQPDVGTCTFTIREQLDRGVEKTILDIVHVGAKVEVWASAQIPMANSQVMTNTGFPGTGQLPAAHWHRLAGTSETTASRSNRHGRQAAWFTRPGVNPEWTSTVALPSLPYPAEGSYPDAWDRVPRLLPGLAWLIEMQVWVPRGAQATLQAYAQIGPYKSSTTTACLITGDTTATGTGAWVTLSGSVELPVGFDEFGAWVIPAIQFSIMPGITWDDTDPETWSDQQLDTWADLALAGVSYVSLITAGPTARQVLVWAGEITSITGQATGDHAVSVSVTASDVGTNLSNMTVSDEPWPKEATLARVNRIVDLANIAGLIVVVGPGLQPIELAYRDVDAQSVMALLQDIAQSVGGVVWITSHDLPGPYVWIEDPGEREAIRIFYFDAEADLVRIGGSDREADLISADDIIRDPVTWTQDVNSVITSVDATWLEEIPPEGVGDETTTEERTVRVRDMTAVATYGLRKLSISTELTNATDAESLALRMLTQARSTAWTVTGYELDTSSIKREIHTLDYSTRLSMIMDLLDATRRIGHAVTLIDVPTYTPAGAVASGYLEGGTYTVQNQMWHMALNLSNAGAQGDSATWADMDDAGDWTWADLDPSIRWVDGYGAAGPIV